MEAKKQFSEVCSLVLSFYLYTGSRDQSQGSGLPSKQCLTGNISLFLADEILKYLGAKQHKSSALKKIQKKADSKIVTTMF